MARIVVLDASALIALLSSRDSHHQWALAMFGDTVEWELRMTALTLAEVMVHPGRAGKLDEFLEAIEGLAIVQAPITESDARRIALIRSKSSLKMPDAVVLGEASKVAGSIATTDHHLAKVARENGLGVFHPG